MIVEPLRTLADWLSREDHGVNANIAALPLDNGDERPPSVSRVLEPTRDPEAQPAHYPLETPFLVVSAESPARWDGEVGQVHRDGQVDLTIRYVTRAGQPETQELQGLYTLRAVSRSIREWLRNEYVEARTLNGVCVRSAQGMILGPIREESQETGAVASAALVLTLQIRDTMP